MNLRSTADKANRKKGRKRIIRKYKLYKKHIKKLAKRGEYSFTKNYNIFSCNYHYDEAIALRLLAFKNKEIKSKYSYMDERYIVSPHDAEYLKIQVSW